MKPQLIIVGLGNPGKEYAQTRHNAGWLALDAIENELNATMYKEQPKFLCTYAEGEWKGMPLLLVKPTTFMNRSGECIRKLVDFYKLDPTLQVLVVCDDIDLPLGSHRFRKNGGPGTHNGLKSIVETMGENFSRHRLGLGTPPQEMDLAAWVLSRFSEEEMKALKPAFLAVITSAEALMSEAKKE